MAFLIAPSTYHAGLAVLWIVERVKRRMKYKVYTNVAGGQQYRVSCWIVRAEIGGLGTDKKRHWMLEFISERVKKQGLMPTCPVHF